jgi:hypothetical protein
MKLALIILLGIAPVAAYSQKTEATEQMLTSLEQDRLKAIVARDSVKLSAMYDDKYNGVLTNGREVTKAGVIEFQMASNPHITISIEAVKAFVYGTVGVTKGTQVNRSKSGTILGQSKFIRVYQKAGNNWKIIYSQGTLMAEE